MIEVRWVLETGALLQGQGQALRFDCQLESVGVCSCPFVPVAVAVKQLEHTQTGQIRSTRCYQ